MHTLRQAWHAWQRLGRFIGDLIGRATMTVFYFTVFVPFAAITRWRSDPLRLKPVPKQSYWIERETRDRALTDARRQS